MEQEIKERLRQVIRENFKDKIVEAAGILDEDLINQDDFQFIDLGFDSILMMMLFTVVEEEFNIVFEDEDLAFDFERFDNLVEFISSKMEKNWR